MCDHWLFLLVLLLKLLNVFLTFFHNFMNFQLISKLDNLYFSFTMWCLYFSTVFANFVFNFLRCTSLKRTWKNWEPGKRLKWSKSWNRCQPMRSDCLGTSKTDTTMTWKCFFPIRRRLTRLPRTSSKRFVLPLWLPLGMMLNSRLRAQNGVGCLSAK